MKFKSFVIGMAMGASLLMALPAGAATLTTDDEVLSIETPDESWAKVEDSNHWFVVTNGKNTITVEHLSNGESLPQASVADDTYPAVYQAFVSTKNEVFVVEGKATNSEELKTLMEAIGTIQVLKYNTKTAVQKKEATQDTASKFSLSAINATYYVTTDELNVRSGCSTDDPVIGVLRYGESVTVNGAVTKDGADYGWYQVQYNGSVGYASASFLSKTKPAEKSSSSSGSGKYALASGFDVYDANGNYVGVLVPYSDGKYYIGEVPFEEQGVGIYFGGAGAGMYVYSQLYYEGISDSGAQQHGLESQGSNRPVTITFYGGAWFDESGAEFSDQGDGTFIEDSTGDVFDVVW